MLLASHQLGNLLHTPVSNLSGKKTSKLHYTCGYYAESCNERRDPSPRLSAWATQKRRSGGKIMSDLTSPVIEPQTSRADSNVANHHGNFKLIIKQNLLSTHHGRGLTLTEDRGSF